MNLIARVTIFPVIMFSFLSLNTTARAAWYEKGIVHQQAVTKLLKRGDARWGEKMLGVECLVLKLITDKVLSRELLS